ncbi:hypothetical protein BN2475_370006 [Paraburkholderia ribeironis]|uniref:Uncharacterized protein n=1 Tax=Paraburkholderia ribeironis TaxID=1247936 RepID=A0A1N7S4T5_9BURK|nr:hypothetical protein BN2475_370006 [Paraburkholderia ribeironis]
MTHRFPSDQNEAVRQWSRQTDPVERAMTRRPSMLTRSPSKDEGRLLPSDPGILAAKAAFNNLAGAIERAVQGDISAHHYALKRFIRVDVASHFRPCHASNSRTTRGQSSTDTLTCVRHIDD